MTYSESYKVHQLIADIWSINVNLYSIRLFRGCSPFDCYGTVASILVTGRIGDTLDLRKFQLVKDL